MLPLILWVKPQMVEFTVISVNFSPHISYFLELSFFIADFGVSFAFFQIIPAMTSLYFLFIIFLLLYVLSEYQ